MNISEITKLENQISKIDEKIDKANKLILNKKNNFITLTFIFTFLSLCFIALVLYSSFNEKVGLIVLFSILFALCFGLDVYFSVMCTIKQKKTHNAELNIESLKSERDRLEKSLVIMKETYNTERLLELKKLLDDKLITEEEFEAKKAIMLLK